MVAHAHHHRPDPLARACLLTALRFRLMTTDGNHFGVNWSGVATAVIGAVLTGGVLGITGGILYIAWTVPSQQEQILTNQRELKNYVEKIEQRFEVRILRLESGRP
jgi:uncharacterized protein (DUF697 family)